MKEEAMDRKIHQYIVLSALMGTLLIMPVVANAETGKTGQGHMKITGVVTAEKSGLLTVKTPVGMLTLNENVSRRHGHEGPKVGDELTI
ncbi:MAG: hypothetical protein ACREI3_04450 [Nitrospirales bacterium]